MNSWCYLTLIVLVSSLNFVSKSTHANIPKTVTIWSAMGTVKLIIWNLYHAICYFILGGKDINTHTRMHAHTQNNTHRQRYRHRQTDRHIQAHRHTDAHTWKHTHEHTYMNTHTWKNIHEHTYMNTQTHTHTHTNTHISRTKAITRNQACIGLWPTHTWLNTCMILIKLLRYSHVTVLVYEVANPLDNCNLSIIYRKVFKNTHHAKLNAERMNAKL